MKKIIPFNNVLKFDTDVREITAISLEHEIHKDPDMISGVFYISGEYKMTDGQLDKEKFNFELPFDIALSNNYELDSLLVDIDDFRYDLISDNELKVNIDLYVDGNEEPTKLDFSKIEEDRNSLESDLLQEQENNEEEIDKDIEYENHFEEKKERVDLLKEMLTTNKENDMEKEFDINIDNNNINNNILDNQDENYVTYRVYKVLENDTIDSILEKYKITKEMLADYNDLENILPGDKLLIPTDEK